MNEYTEDVRTLRKNDLKIDSRDEAAGGELYVVLASRDDPELAAGLQFNDVAGVKVSIRVPCLRRRRVAVVASL
jgi:hypothetical protein